MEYLVIWGFFGIIAGSIAGAKGRSGFGWFVLGLLLGPFSLVVALLPSLKPSALFIPSVKLRPCPRCAELIQPEARFCRYCNGKLEPLPVVRDLRCFNCSHLNPTEALRCEKCGSLINVLALFK